MDILGFIFYGKKMRQISLSKSEEDTGLTLYKKFYSDLLSKEFASKQRENLTRNGFCGWDGIDFSDLIDGENVRKISVDNMARLLLSMVPHTGFTEGNFRVMKRIKPSNRALLSNENLNNFNKYIHHFNMMRIRNSSRYKKKKSLKKAKKFIVPIPADTFNTEEEILLASNLDEEPLLKDS